MKKIILTSAFAVMGGLITLSVLPLQAQETTANPVEAEANTATVPGLTQAQIEEIVRRYLLNNGDVVIESVEVYQQRKQEIEQRAAADALKDSSDFLLKNTNSPEAGNPDASVTLVEFFDYNCGYCKKALVDVQELLEEDSDLRVVFKEVPILSPSSRNVTKWSLASKKQGKYFEYHSKLMAHRGQYDDKTLEKYAVESGLDVAQLKKDKDSAEIEAAINENLSYMEKFGIRGTPSFIVGNEFARGYVGKDKLKQLVSDLRVANTK